MEGEKRIDLQGQLKVVRKVEKILVEQGIIHPYPSRYNRGLTPTKTVLWACELKEPVLEDSIILPGQQGDWLTNSNKEREKSSNSKALAPNDFEYDREPLGREPDNSQSKIGESVATEEARLVRDWDV